MKVVLRRGNYLLEGVWDPVVQRLWHTKRVGDEVGGGDAAADGDHHRARGMVQRHDVGQRAQRLQFTE